MHTGRLWRSSIGRVLAALLPLWASGCQQSQPSFADVESGSVGLIEAERHALRRLLGETGLKASELDVSGHVGAVNSAWIRDGQVRSLKLRDQTLHDLAALAGLSALEQVRIEGGQLSFLTGLDSDCALRSLFVSRAQLVDAQGIANCTGLTDLSLPGNGLTTLPDFASMSGLRHLDLSGNALAGALQISGLPELESLNLAQNRLEQCPQIHGLPNLRRLALSRNRLTDLSGLGELGSLRELLVDHNELQDASALDRYAQLEVVNLNHNQLQRFPLLVSTLDPLSWSANPGYLRRLAADHDERRARLTESGLSEALPDAQARLGGFSAGSCSWAGNRVSCRLSLAEVAGAQRVYLARWRADPLRSDPRRRGVAGVVLRLSVAEGTVRAYLNRQAQAVREAEANPQPEVRVGYPYVEASANDPKALAGQLFNDSSGLWLLLQAQTELARGVELEIEPGYVP